MEKKIRKVFSPDEDTLLKALIEKYGFQWNAIADHMPSRNSRQCRDRWNNYLRPKINQSPWTEAEDKLLYQKYGEYGPKWYLLSEFFNNRTLNNIKNRWNTIYRKSNMLGMNLLQESDFLICAKLVNQRNATRKIVSNNPQTTQKETNDDNIDIINPIMFLTISNLLNHQDIPLQNFNNVENLSC